MSRADPLTPVKTENVLWGAERIRGELLKIGIALSKRTIVTNSPSDEWTAQQLREATPWGTRPKYLIHDRDGKFGPQYSAVAKSSEIEEVKTPFRTPQANGICERFMGSLRRERLDHILIHNDSHLARVIKEYTIYFNQDRPHQGIDQRIPGRFDLPTSKPIGQIRSRPILGGLHHRYSRAKTLN